MWPLKRRASAGAPARDPAPSMWRYRLNRLMRRRWVRRAATRYLPLGAVAAAALWVALTVDLRELSLAQYEAVRAAIADRPEFAVRRVLITGGTALVRADVKAALALPSRLSSLDVDPQALRTRAETLGWVETARVSLEAPETLRIQLTERTPAALWRRDQRLVLIDAEGVEIAPVAARADWPELPLVAGPGADLAVAEALALIETGAPLASDLRGLVRVGARRWDMVFPAYRIQLPQDGAAEALTRLMKLEAATLLTERDVTIIDLRDPQSLTLRLGPAAQDLREKRKAAPTPGEET